MNTNYKAGYRAELRCKYKLQSEGYEVIRATGSKGLFDLIGISEKNIKLIQVKNVQYRKLRSFTNVKDKITDFKVPKCCRRELWVWEKHVGFHIYKIENGKIL